MVQTVLVGTLAFCIICWALAGGDFFQVPGFPGPSLHTAHRHLMLPRLLYNSFRTMMVRGYMIAQFAGHGV
jgi:hypothetical protein